MKTFTTLLLAAVASTLPVLGNTYGDCQRPKAQGTQLQGCPNGTLYVSQTDPQAEYGTIQDAVESLADDDSTQYILVGSGNYHEVVNVTRKGPLTIMGMTSSPSDYTANTVFLFNSSYINQTSQTASQDNADAVVLTVSPSRNASLVGAGPTGAPLQPLFGNSDFRMYNVDIANRAYTAGDTGPSAALFVSYANASFYECTFSSYQDTLYVGRNGSAVFVGGEVVGTTDFIYGFGTAYFENTTLSSRNTGGGLVAWKGSEEFYGPDTFGAYFNNSRVVKAADANATLDLTGTRALGRPWNNQSRVVFMNTYMSDIVLPQGFIEWSASDPRVFPNVTHFIESGSYGPGWNPSARNYSVESVISPEQAQSQYSVSAVFGGFPTWVDSVYVYN
uniref:pectinesterase n=1 Tax=Kwoniella dejecticola CBS 10117 TaxID=1296121 RepID=A0A1A6A0A0_9TREE|nr:uncharacterized protein I303_05764 [Kwoniella dejecticola CBS 10117]OBR83485.1 hypothetical protein I303_05764 [Kwoniella dejecticola CBS 10117]